MDQALQGLEGYRKIVDDIVIYDNTLEEHVTHVRQFLQRCRERNITLNAEKFIFGQERVTFAGLQLSAGGYSLDKKIVQAIQEFPVPASRTDLRSFVGLVNQLSSSSSAITAILEPLRPLLKTKNVFVWDTAHEEAFTKAKAAIMSPLVLDFFDPTRETRVCTDASRKGLGFVCQQFDGSSWRLIYAGSQCLTAAESRYAIIELEMLGVNFAVRKCRMFVEGLQSFKIITDHAPLVPIINKHRLDEIENPRLQRLR